MTKNAGKERQRQKRQQKARERRNAKRAAIQYRLPGASSTVIPDFDQSDLLFWIAHGCNYIQSDLKQGIWDPLFPEIYTGEQATVEIITQRILTHHGATLEQDTWSVGKALVAWSVQDPAVVWAFRQKSLMNLGPDTPEAAEMLKQPHVEAVWAVFEDLKTQIHRANQK